MTDTTGAITGVLGVSSGVKPDFIFREYLFGMAAAGDMIFV